MSFLLDTNILSAHLRRPSGLALGRRTSTFPFARPCWGFRRRAADDDQKETSIPKLESPMKKSKLPKTDSIPELADFWDRHDLTDFEGELAEVAGPVFVRVTAIKVPLGVCPSIAFRRRGSNNPEACCRRLSDAAGICYE
jgi:hypothetical protein